MSTSSGSFKIKPGHLARRAVVYIRQSSERQVLQNKESQRLQYELAQRARDLGWKEVQVVDADLGASASMGAVSRIGFENVISSVALQEVGLVLSREVSRLSRTDKDWCQLMEVCEVFDTLVADDDKVYDLKSTDDRLVLGIKGTISAAELSTMKTRLQGGIDAKARRGELFRILPPGYICDATGEVVKDPDQRVQQAISMVFEKFSELWSGRQTLLWFKEQGVELPVNKPAGGRMRLIWQLPTYSFVQSILRSPFYAGAYLYGRRPVEMKFESGGIIKQKGRCRRPEECRVFIRNHHEGYIDWASYEENRRIMQRNAQRSSRDETTGAVQKGTALLAGLLRCGRCGRRLHVRYSGRHGTAVRYACRGDYEGGGKRCLGFSGRAVDRRFGEELLEVISPLGTEASVAALKRSASAEDERRQALAYQFEQAEYQARRAFEQYDEVDPRNRLVARELELRWNDKLEEVNKLKSVLRELDEQARQLTDEERFAIARLGECFADVWHSEHCPIDLKKKIVRTVVEEVVVDEPGADFPDGGSTLRFIIHWKGGSHTQFEIAGHRGRAVHKTSEEDLEIIRRMAVRHGDDVIAGVLNKLGRRTGKGKRWNQHRVYSARRSHSIPGHRRTPQDPEILSLGAAARYAGVSADTIKRLVASGLLRKEQVVPWAPWEIQRSDLSSEPVSSALMRLKQTGKLGLKGGSADSQEELFQ